ncbi:MAG: tetratricopeptide repeat protein [Allosphingosinicella sp.]|uniref:tetratricopeptide repeat protein n=1 Tax=Allosphingosinicella sp. TaxID=2823234 RepID=UPI00394E0254
MAIKPTENETFYREVDEELRKERFSQAFQRYGWLIIGLAVLLLVAAGGWIYWQHRQDVRAGEQGEALVGVLDDIEAGRREGAAQRLDELADGGNRGYRVAALFTKAGLAMDEGNEAAAIEALQAISGDTAVAEPYRQAALLRQTQIEFDRLQPAQVIERLGPLAQAGNPWFGSAGEMVAAAHIKAGRPQAAGPILTAISRDENVPEPIRSRAVQMAAALGLDAAVEAPAAGNAAGEGAAEENSQ